MQKDRLFFRKKIEDSLQHYPVTALVGSRQSGKTTLARQISELYAKKGPVHFFDLELPEHALKLSNPSLALSELKGLIIIDEIQRNPDIFPLLRVLADREELPARFLILGSASGKLLQQASESLAGRISDIELPGFCIHEVELNEYNSLWLRGGYPKSFLATDENISYDWRQKFIQTFLERDIPGLGVKVPAAQLWRFWQMITHYHGQVANYSDLGKSLGVTHHTIKHYLDILTDAFMIRQLPPWYNNIGKRLVKSPKIYIRDSGLFHALLGVQNISQLRMHPKLGASWEGFVFEQLIQLNQDTRNAFFWATYSHAEIDLIVNRKGKQYGFEIKFEDAPRTTRSMHEALKSLPLERLYVIYPGNTSYILDEKIEVVPLAGIKMLFEQKL